MSRQRNPSEDIWGNFRKWYSSNLTGEDFWDERPVPVQDLRFTQDSIAFELKDGSSHILGLVLQFLDTGDFSSISLAAVLHNGVYYSCNNRRLAALKIYAHVSRAVMKSVYDDERYNDIQMNQQIKIADSYFTPYFEVPCAIRRFSDYNCSHDVECHGSPQDRNVLDPRLCKDIRVRRINVTAHAISRSLSKMFTTGELDAEFLTAMRDLHKTLLYFQKKASDFRRIWKASEDDRMRLASLVDQRKRQLNIQKRSEHEEPIKRQRIQ